MLDIKFVRENRDLVIKNIEKKFQEEKIHLVDKVIELDERIRTFKSEGDMLRSQRNEYSREIGNLMRDNNAHDAEIIKGKVSVINSELVFLEEKEEIASKELEEYLMIIPNIMDESVPIGKDDSENVELEVFGEKKLYDFDVPYHVEILEGLNGIDLDSARKTSGSGFYYLTGNIARLHSAILSYAREFMIQKGFEYVIPPYMIRSDIVKGVMSQSEMNEMMYKIEGEDLYLIGTSEHSMIGRYVDTITDEATLPHKLTSYSPCFRKEKGAHGIEERGIYRIHQFEKQEMIVVCKPSESMDYFHEMYGYTIELFRSLNITVRKLECCSGDLADLKVKSIDIEAWSPRQQKFFEVCSCSNLGDAQARRLKMRVKDESGNKYFPHTLNNTVVAPPRMLIAFIENNLNEDLSVNVPEALRPFMGGLEKIDIKK